MAAQVRAEQTRSGAEPRSQAVDRIADILEALAAAATPLSLNQVAGAIHAHRSVAYRCLRTLEDRRLVDRVANGYRLGELLLVLANAVHSDLRDASLIELSQLSARFGATSFITIDDGGRSVCLQTVEPSRTLAHVAIRPGVWGPADVGAPAIAILSGRPATVTDLPDVVVARERGYAASSGNEYDARGLQWVGAPIPAKEGVTRASVCMVFPRGTHDVAEVGEALHAAAQRLGATLAAG